jgi:hypothetical protein
MKQTVLNRKRIMVERDESAVINIKTAKLYLMC